MKSALINLLKGMIIVCGIVLLHFTLTLLLSYPLSAVNIIFSILVIILLEKETGMVVWLSFFVHFIIELYAVTPFGITLISGTLSILFGYWIYRYLFTNRSWYTAGVLTMISLLIYRILFSILLFVQTTIVSKQDIVWSNLLGLFGLELILTTAVTVTLFLILSRFSSNLKKDKIFASWFKILSPK